MIIKVNVTDTFLFPHHRSLQYYYLVSIAVVSSHNCVLTHKYSDVNKKI